MNGLRGPPHELTLDVSTWFIGDRDFPGEQSGTLDVIMHSHVSWPSTLAHPAVVEGLAVHDAGLQTSDKKKITVVTKSVLNRRNQKKTLS